MDSGNSIDRVEEIKSIQRVFNAFLGHQQSVEQEIRRWESNYRLLPPQHKETLSNLPKKYSDIRRCAELNMSFISAMLEAFQPPFLCSSEEENCSDEAELPEQREGKSGVKMSSVSPESGFDSERREAPQRDKHARVSGGFHGQESISAALQQAESELDPKFGPESVQPELSRRLNPQYRVPPEDSEKVQCMLRSFVRDWSSEGREEREQCYTPVLQELQRMFPPSHRAANRPPSCLVPGAGLCRLSLEISRLGFVCQGNEFSTYTMLCSNFVLNHVAQAREWRIFPWLASSCNVVKDEDQLAGVFVPDMAPCEAQVTPGFSMCAGDFEQVYSQGDQRGAWDSVVTCFFLDTAPNVVRYIEVLAGLLRPGGVWVNFGPLLYHFASPSSRRQSGQAVSLELSLEDVQRVAVRCGFTVVHEEMREATYTANPRSMMRTQYRCALWTMVKH